MSSRENGAMNSRRWHQLKAERDDLSLFQSETTLTDKEPPAPGHAVLDGAGRRPLRARPDSTKGES